MKNKNNNNKYIEYNWSLTLWNGDNFRKWKWYAPCSCGCDSRGDTEDNYEVGYYSGGLGLFGFTLSKRRIDKSNTLKSRLDRGELTEEEVNKIMKRYA
jgi:hypothetical protein|tara:strand:+ start:382 stop:675 length:294 start_codon:yes stop_codon:yes gene_type:complete